MSKLRLLDLFSGIGGFSLGLERTGGFETVAFCEIEEFPRRVLAKHWPEVPCYDDVRTLTAESLQRDGIGVDAICGGFPCQDISTAGKGAGIEGERSGLWVEFARLIGELRPQVVFVENVSALLSRGLNRVLGDLAALGYDAEWHCIPASAVGAPHRRDRVWLVAHAGSERARSVSESLQAREPQSCGGGAFTNSDKERCLKGWQCFPATRSDGIERDYWRQIKSPVCRVDDGLSDRVDRLKALGNAVVPQIPELLGNAYLESIGWRSAA